MRNIYFTLIIFTLISCNDTTYPSRTFIDGYMEIKDNYPYHLINHLPDFHKDLYGREYKTSSGRYIGKNYLNYIYIYMRHSGERLEQVKTYAEENAVKKYFFTDSCFLVINYNESIYDKSPIKLKNCKDASDLLPVPNFKKTIDENYPLRFYENATIYVLGAEKGNFIDDDDDNNYSRDRDEIFVRSENLSLPKEWEHGYSKGIVISGKDVFYWIDIW